jgi:hypothetical protein
MFSSHKPGDHNLKFSIYDQINSWASTYIYLLKQTLLFYIHVNVKNVYLSLNMLNMSFSKQFYIFARIFFRTILQKGGILIAHIADDNF